MSTADGPGEGRWRAQRVLWGTCALKRKPWRVHFSMVSWVRKGWMDRGMDGGVDEQMDTCKSVVPHKLILVVIWAPNMHVPTTVPFSFDPNSAAGWLGVSEDLTSVTNGGYKLLVENPERFTSAPCVLGSRGFSTGFHTWEVDLGGIKNWRVGVARPSSGTHWTFHHDARSGFWYIYCLPGSDGEMCRVSNTARSEAALGNLRRIRVELDCDEGELSFYDADNKTHIYTFHEKFGSTVFPYFYVGATPVGTSSEALRICPLRVCIQEDVSV